MDSAVNNRHIYSPNDLPNFQLFTPSSRGLTPNLSAPYATSPDPTSRITDYDAHQHRRQTEARRLVRIRPAIETTSTHSSQLNTLDINDTYISLEDLPNCVLTRDQIIRLDNENSVYLIHEIDITSLRDVLELEDVAKRLVLVGNKVSDFHELIQWSLNCTDNDFPAGIVPFPASRQPIDLRNHDITAKKPWPGSIRPQKLNRYTLMRELTR